MPELKREDLKYQYDWSNDLKDKRHTAIHGDDFIDRKNGYHMLDFMNRFLKINGLFSVSSRQRLEKLMYKYLPEKINTRAEIKIWLGQNWNKHF
ncbi:hypothetical protein R1T16_08330 [Flavobacterium sp. DG1-102-2]|uniref:hypothetical protein n=1 Tax=Flavobacterium sp. DG1-102-2 TaxID=3081663 RepID=UPI002949FACB|nr:hypothetical protein [Flavobacterium sp. DG1-102-2]MDV6168432.1 hypothetical protein [Flavobacterium sp. DG1-102-2]